MFEVTVGIADRADLSEQMEAMRTWLDQRRFEPKIFRYRYLSKAVIFKVTFSVEREAAEFARAFDGALTSGSPLVI